jgi:hypothetical protein
LGEQVIPSVIVKGRIDDRRAKRCADLLTRHTRGHRFETLRVYQVALLDGDAVRCW